MITYTKTIKHLITFDKGVKAISYKLSTIVYHSGVVKIFNIANLTDAEQTALDDFVSNFNDIYDVNSVTAEMIEFQEGLGHETVEKIKLSNRLAGITDPQSAHYLKRSSVPLSMLREGLLQSAKDETLLVAPDDMTESYHFVTQARLDAAVVDIDLAITAANDRLTELTA